MPQDCVVSFMLRTESIFYKGTLNCRGEGWSTALRRLVLPKPEIAGCWGGGSVEFADGGSIVFQVEKGDVSEVW